ETERGSKSPTVLSSTPSVSVTNSEVSGRVRETERGNKSPTKLSSTPSVSVTNSEVSGKERETERGSKARSMLQLLLLLSELDPKNQPRIFFSADSGSGKSK
ncbi:MAG: hypothetical protein ACO3FI_01940, partial [Cyclobacteriaceae bacterium]